MMHRARGHQRAHRHAIGRHRTIAKDREAVAILDRLLGLSTNAIERLAHPGNAGLLRERDVDLLRAPAAIIHALERVQFFVGENWMRHMQALRMAFGGFEQILFRPNVTLERHDDFLTDRIDRGIGHLSKELAEIIVDHPRLVAETSKRGIVTHRAKRIALLMHERQEHELKRLGGEPKGLHALQERGFIQPRGLAGSSNIVHLDTLVLEPVAIGSLRGEFRLNLVIWHNPALLEIHEE